MCLRNKSHPGYGKPDDKQKFDSSGDARWISKGIDGNH